MPEHSQAPHEREPGFNGREPWIQDDCTCIINFFLTCMRSSAPLGGIHCVYHDWCRPTPPQATPLEGSERNKHICM